METFKLKRPNFWVSYRSSCIAGTKALSPTFNNSAFTLSQTANEIYKQSSFCLLWEQIYPTRHKLNSTSWKLVGICLCLAGEFFKAIWTLIACITFEKGARVNLDRKKGQCGKFQHYTRPNTQLLCYEGTGRQLQQLVAGWCCMFIFLLQDMCPVYLMPLDPITVTLFGEKYKLWSFSYSVFCTLAYSFFCTNTL